MAEGQGQGKVTVKDNPLQAVRNFWRAEVRQKMSEETANMLTWHFKSLPGNSKSLRCRLCGVMISIGFEGFNLIHHMVQYHPQDMTDWRNPKDDMLKAVSNLTPVNAKFIQTLDYAIL